MVRLDLQFFLCCCRACLGKPSTDEANFYELLGISKDASVDDIKRAYKRRSLDLHPDKLAQKGKVVTEADQAKFTRMKEAYEVLSDKHKRETYDAIGEKGMKWIEEPMSIDPQEMANNFANSSTLDRSKIFAIFLGIAIAVFVLPILICLQVDGIFGANSSWAVVATPLWIWNAFLLFYHVRIIMMGPIERPEHIPEEEWMDPLPMSKRYMALSKFFLYFIFQVLAVLNLDGVIAFKWTIIFLPIFIVEFLTYYRKQAQAVTEVITVEELEAIIGKPSSEITNEEKEAYSKSYTIFPSKSSEAYQMAKAVQESAKTDLIKIGFRVVFFVFLLVQLDTGANWSWWLVFAPFFTMSCCLCCNQCQKYSEVQANAAELFDDINRETEGEGGIDYGAMEEGQSTAENQGKQPLSAEQKEEIKSQVLRESYKACSTCCSQAFFLLLIFLCLGKMQGAGYSSLWIISPFLFLASIILCALGCTIFCISPIDGDEMDAAYQNMNQNIFNGGVGFPQPAGNETAQPFTNASPDTNTNDIGTNPLKPDEVTKTGEPTKKTEEAKILPQAQVVDLLDDQTNYATTTQSQITKPVNADGLEPTSSEVDDLD